jgi:hypothetical protein
MCIEDITTNMVVICSPESPSPLAFANVYEVGDIWIKVRGCEDCPTSSIVKCCGTCPFVSDKGCFHHLNGGRLSSKPYGCVVFPLPVVARSWCVLEFKCIKGSNKGKVRRVSDAMGKLVG